MLHDLDKSHHRILAFGRSMLSLCTFLLTASLILRYVMVPVLPPDRKGQDRGNSGIYLQGLYELQVLDSYDNPTYVNGEAGSIYKQSALISNKAGPRFAAQTRRCWRPR